MADLAVDTGTISNVPDSRQSIIFIGDSITEGIVCVNANVGVLPSNSCGEQSYGVVTAKTLNLAPIMNGFGSSGLITSGLGGVPPALDNYANFMNGKPINVALEAPKYAVINLGTNDTGDGYQQNLTQLIKQVLANGAQRVFVMRPFISDTFGFANHVPEINLAIAALKDTRVFYVDTTSWVFVAEDFEGAHPTRTGHAKIANLLTQFIQSKM